MDGMDALGLQYRINQRYVFQAIIPESYEWQLPLKHKHDQDGVEETKETVVKLKELIARGESQFRT